MNCPRCEGSVLDEREREGVVVDSCPSCRGLWLDRGELEKIAARMSRGGRDDRDGDDGDDDDGDSGEGRRRRGGGLMDFLGGLVD
ncbi:MAG: zf-TFIIB domain-containing protein [Planctomycetaceae bacterium]|nr:zf-TFIIB domain-containing protein [Planctomycetota bacterium]NUN53071.1 zf-TFIIB domain-containing protein [Planctomycetaceae bacterium]